MVWTSFQVCRNCSYIEVNKEPPRLLIAKVVDDFLIAGARTEISNFRFAISDRFEVGRFSQDISVVVHCLHIKQHSSGDINGGVHGHYISINLL